jgi:NADH:ubiquinone oxidoreductase subunit 2 (subunit N)
LRTLVTFFISNILSVWFIIELNFLCFVRILSFDLKQNNTNGNIYYFLIQSLGRVIILIRALNFLFFNNFFFEYIFRIFLLAKLGGAPFHFWYLKLIQKLRWFNIWLISVWQKLIPLLIIKLIIFNFLLIFGLLGVIVGRISNLNQKKIKKILGLSSIFSLGWVLLSILQRKIWTLFIIGYGLILIVLLNRIRKLYFYNNENLENLNFSVLFYLLFFSALLIIRGIPPFIIFYIKILILFSLIEFSFLIVLILLIFRVLIIYIYLIIGFSLLTFLKDKTFFINIYFFNIYLLNYLIYNFLFSIILISFL